MRKVEHGEQVLSEKARHPDFRRYRQALMIISASDVNPGCYS
jgi:hypothetical protein